LQTKLKFDVRKLNPSHVIYFKRNAVVCLEFQNQRLSELIIIITPLAAILEVPSSAYQHCPLALLSFLSAIHPAANSQIIFLQLASVHGQAEIEQTFIQPFRFDYITMQSHHKHQHSPSNLMENLLIKISSNNTKGKKES
jgi:hypothetical protein